MTLGITSGGGKSTAIGIGMWLGLIMAFNVWFVIWPNQKRALGIVDADAETKANLQRQQCCFLEQILYCHYQCFYPGRSTKLILVFFSSSFFTTV